MTEREFSTPSTTVIKRANSLRSAAEEARHFIVVTGADGNKRWLMVGQAPLVIGRAAPADVVVADSSVSRQHCRIELIDDHLYVTDLGSTNGTIVNGQGVSGPTRLRSGTQFAIGDQSIGYERRLRGAFEEIEALERDLQSASRYVQMLLPEPLNAGPVRASWHFLPSARVGGDAFGYGPIDTEHWGGFILDVTGHGAGAALHAATLLNLMRRRAITGVDLRDPGAVITALNALFQADTADVPMFTVWGFSYELATRTLSFSSGGHHPAFLVTSPDRRPKPINTPCPIVGMIPGRIYRTETVTLPENARLYLFSDGVFEIERQDGIQLTLHDFLPVLEAGASAPRDGEPGRIYREIRAMAKPGPLADDFSVVVLEFT